MEGPFRRAKGDINLHIPFLQHGCEVDMLHFV